MTAPSRGDIWWVDLEPAQGGEIRKTRPAIVVSNETACRVQNRVQVVPISSRAEKIFAWEALIAVRGQASKATADQIRTVALHRLKEFIGKATAAEMKAVENAIRIQLGL